LPRTLTHGDMHPANIMRRADGSPVIIDWGNACLAPPMLDLANIIELGSQEWATYVAAYQAAGGAFDAAVAERAFWWARAITGLMYIAWAVDNSDRATDLIAQIEDAAARLAALPRQADARA
jgi:thiamine kinase-like enzyme